jgi:hypothetical protein
MNNSNTRHEGTKARRHGVKGGIVSFGSCALLAIGLCGCAQPTVATNAELFAPDNEPKAMNLLLNSQASAGAASDATLFTCHFHGADLNSSGTTKLDLILADGGKGPLKIWMAVADDELAESRRVAVGTYLKDHGVPLDDIQFGRGANPDTNHPAAKGLLDLPKADSTDSSSTASPTASTGASPTGGTTTGVPGGSPGTP